MIDRIFSRFDRSFVLSFEKEDERAILCRIIRTIELSFTKYYLPTVQIKDYNVLIDGKHFNDPIKSKEET